MKWTLLRNLTQMTPYAIDGGKIIDISEIPTIMELKTARGVHRSDHARSGAIPDRRDDSTRTDNPAGYVMQVLLPPHEGGGSRAGVSIEEGQIRYAGLKPMVFSTFRSVRRRGQHPGLRQFGNPVEPSQAYLRASTMIPTPP